MANQVCRPCRELLRQQLGLLRQSNTATSYQQASLVAATRIHRRQLHHSTSRNDEKSTTTTASTPKMTSDLAKNLMPSVATKAFGTYVVYGATENIYKACSKPVKYTISEKLRKQEKVPLSKDGEEIGVGGGIWHDRTYRPQFRWSLACSLPQAQLC